MGIDTKQTTAEGRADHNLSGEKDNSGSDCPSLAMCSDSRDNSDSEEQADPANPLAAWNPDNIQYAESTECIRTTDNYATDLIPAVPVISSGNNHHTDDLNGFDADNADQGMRRCINTPMNTSNVSAGKYNHLLLLRNMSMQLDTSFSTIIATSSLN